MTKRDITRWAIAVLDFGSSLKTGVWILACFVLVVFFGTLYQVNHGLHAAQESFYYAWLTPPVSQWPADGSEAAWTRLASWMPLPLPGGMLVMWALFINLSLSLVKRLRYLWRKAGVILIHVGLLLMLGGGWVAHRTAQEGFLSLAEGDRSAFAISYLHWELAVWEAASQPEQAPFTFAAGDLAPGDVMKIEDLGLTLTVEAYYPNARTRHGDPSPSGPVALNVGGITGIEPEPLRGDPGAYMPGVQVLASLDRQEPQRLIFHGSDPGPLVLSLPESEWYLHLRKRPMMLPLEIQLLEFSKVFEPHTTIPRSFSSRILVDKSGVQREVLVEMNRPFRYGGFTFFQSSYGTAEDGRDASIFAVSHNRAMWAPYIATGLTGLGMVVQFLIQWIGPTRKKRLGVTP